MVFFHYIFASFSTKYSPFTIQVLQYARDIPWEYLIPSDLAPSDISENLFVHSLKTRKETPQPQEESSTFLSCSKCYCTSISSTFTFETHRQLPPFSKTLFGILLIGATSGWNLDSRTLIPYEHFWVEWKSTNQSLNPTTHQSINQESKNSKKD